MTVCYSYVRFSSERQADGHSLERQFKAAQEYAAANGFTLDSSSYRDLGVSAFKSKNAVEGALGLFLQAVEEHKIPKGSYLLIESFDRLSRDEVDIALELFLTLTRKGIIIVTLKDKQVYSKATIRDNWTKLISALVEMARANEESATKSFRVKQAWDKKVASGELAITKIPSWLKVNEKKDGFVVNKERAAIINRIFDLILQGRTQREVAALFAAEGVATLQYATRWTHSRVSHMLNNPAVYGERPGPNGRSNYYPPIMTKKKAMMARDIVSGRRWKGTQVKGQIANLFAGIAWCSECGSRMAYRPSSIEHPYMHCTKASDDLACNNRLFPYRPSERGLIYTLSRKAGIDISGRYIAEQSVQEKELIDEIEKVKDQQVKAMKIATLTDGTIEAVASELRSLQNKLMKLQGELKNLNHHPITNDELKEHRDLFDRYYFEIMEQQWDGQPVDVELRRQLKIGITRMVQKLEFGRDKDGWSPLIYITLIDGTRGNVKLVDYMTDHSLKIQRARHAKKRKRK
jgi:DNA invertase Pin-like site-specific DNA recombinase